MIALYQRIAGREDYTLPPSAGTTNKRQETKYSRVDMFIQNHKISHLCMVFAISNMEIMATNMFIFFTFTGFSGWARRNIRVYISYGIFHKHMTNAIIVYFILMRCSWDI